MDGEDSEQNNMSSEIAATRSDTQPRRAMIQHCLLVYIHTNSAKTNEDCQNVLEQLQTVAYDTHAFTHIDAAIDFLTEFEEMKARLIIDDTLSQQIIPLIHDIPQLNSVYILCINQCQCEQWTKNWGKIKGAHTEVKSICEALQLDMNQRGHDSIAMSFLKKSDETHTQNLDQLEPTFMYTQIFKEILLELEYNEQSIKNFTTHCRQNDYTTLSNIDRFEEEYRSESAIWWYSSHPFIYSVLNYALRTMEADIIIKMGFFICDLHRQIKELYQKQINAYNGETFVVYRGQGLLKKNFDELLKIEGGLISFNNFLSISKDRDVSLVFADIASANIDLVGVLFVISIDSSISSAPFASIQEMSSFTTEEEILFSMHTVFRVHEIKQMDDNNQLYQVELQLTADDDEQLRVLTDHIGQETEGSTGWERLGSLLLKIGRFGKAEELYEVLLKQASSDDARAFFYNQLASVKYYQGDHKLAIVYHEKVRDIYETMSLIDHLPRATTYCNITGAYNNMGEYPKALSYCEKAMDIYRESLFSDHSVLATGYNNIGMVYQNMGEYSKALSSCEKTLEIRQKILPTNHPDLGISYNNIGSIYNHMGEYSKALSSYEKAREILEKTLPSNHPSLAHSHNNMGGVYMSMAEYSKALSFFEKAFEIHQNGLSPNQHSLATSYSNLGGVYMSMGEYSKALSLYEKTVEIHQNSLSLKYHALAIAYDNIAQVYINMGEYPKALSFCGKNLEIQQKILPTNHPDLAVSYNNLGRVYDNMEEYSKALPFYEKAREIFENTFPANHPSLANCYNNIGQVYTNLEEYSKALSFHEKAFEIYQKCLPPNHPTLAISYSNIGTVYMNIDEYFQALLFFETALKIRQQSLPSNHTLLGTTLINIGALYYEMEEYSKALTFAERGLEIFENTLPSNHPYVQGVKETIEMIRMDLYTASHE